MAFLTLLKKIVRGITNCIFQILRKKEAISTLISGKGSDYVKIAYQITSGTYQVSTYAAELNNSMDGSQTASSYYYDGLLGNGQGYKADSLYKENDNITITLITDNRSLEIFFPNGQTYTLARFNTSGKQDVKVFSTQERSTIKLENLRCTLITIIKVMLFASLLLFSKDRNETFNSFSNNCSWRSYVKAEMFSLLQNQK